MPVTGCLTLGLLSHEPVLGQYLCEAGWRWIWVEEKLNWEGLPLHLQGTVSCGAFHSWRGWVVMSHSEEA